MELIGGYPLLISIKVYKSSLHNLSLHNLVCKGEELQYFSMFKQGDAVMLDDSRNCVAVLPHDLPGFTVKKH